MRIQLSPIKPDIKDVCKSGKQCHLPHNSFENAVIFHENTEMIRNGFVTAKFKAGLIQSPEHHMQKDSLLGLILYCHHLTILLFFFNLLG